MNFLKIVERVSSFVSGFKTELLTLPDSLCIVTISLINCQSSETIKTSISYINREKDSIESFFSAENYNLRGASCSTVRVSPEEIVLVSVASTTNKDADYLCHQIADSIRSM